MMTSNQTSPVNHSAGPFAVAAFVRISIALLLVLLADGVVPARDEFDRDCLQLALPHAEIGARRTTAPPRFG
jgi:hypothetical protein